MNRTDLADTIAIENGLSRSEAKRWIDAVTNAIAMGLEKESQVSLRGFGIFKMRWRQEKRTRHPRTGEPLTLAPRRAIVFTASKKLTSGGPDIAESCHDSCEAANGESDFGEPASTTMHQV